MLEHELADLPVHTPSIPPLDLQTYRLQVEGAVQRPLSLTVDALRALPTTTVTADFHCLEGWVVRDRTWQGVSLGTILALAGLEPDARFVAVWGADHAGRYNILLTREQVLAPTSILAWAKDGNALDHAQGAPFRLYVPDTECFIQVKWVHRLAALRAPIAAEGERIAVNRLQQRQ